MQICLYNSFGSDDDSRAYCTNDTVNKKTPKKQQHYFACDPFSSQNNLGCLKQNFFLKRSSGQSFTSAFMTYCCQFYGGKDLYKYLWCFGLFSRSYKAFLWKRQHNQEYTTHFTIGFLCIFLLILWRKNFHQSLMVFLTIFHKFMKLRNFER